MLSEEQVLKLQLWFKNASKNITFCDWSLIRKTHFYVKVEGESLWSRGFGVEEEESEIEKIDGDEKG